jgi:hypothetical protein
MFRMEREAADRNAAGLKAILLEVKSLIAQLAGLNEEEVQLGLTFTEAEHLGAKVCTLSYADELILSLAQRGDVIILATESNAMPLDDAGGEIQENSQGGVKLIDQVLKLLNGDRSVKRLIDKPSYRRAMAALPAPESERFFFDATNLFADLDRGFTWIRQSLPESARLDSKPWLRAARKGLDHFRFIDCTASVETTEGFSTHCYSVTLLTPNAKDKPFYKAICGTPPVQQFDKYIPKTAVGFSVTSGIDWTALYEAITGYIRDEIPGGTEILDSWDTFQEEKGFHLDRDLLSWLGNEMISVSMKPAVPNPFGGGDWVLLVQVKDQSKAEEAIRRGVAKLTGLLGGGQSPPLTTQPAKSPALKGFQSLMFPPMAMFLRPVYGFADNYLIIGSSEKAIARCLKTARGEAPSVLENKRYIREGLAPDGPVTSVSFADKSKMGQQMAQALGMLGMSGAMMPIQADEQSAKMLRTIFGMAQKLAPVVAQINFYKSEASVTTFDGKMFRSEKVTHYKKPRPPEAADEPSPATASAESGPRGGKALAARD